jgi:hypothetical protein
MVLMQLMTQSTGDNMACNIPPKGWKCTRDAGHSGPCAALKIPWYIRLLNAIGTAIGNTQRN